MVGNRAGAGPHPGESATEKTLAAAHSPAPGHVNRIGNERRGARGAELVIKTLGLYLGVMVSCLLLSWIIYFYHPNSDQRPLFDKADRFKDLLNYFQKTQHLLHSSAALGTGYPVFSYSPPSAFLWKALMYFPNHLLPYYVLVSIAVITFTVIGIAACGTKYPGGHAACIIGATALLGWPLWFVADRANLEGLMWAISGAGVCLFLLRRYRSAAVFFALAACVKPFPLVFCLLLLLRRRYKETAVAVGTAAGIILTACVVLGPNPWKVYNDLKPGFALYNRGYIQTIRAPGETRFSHSVLDELKLATVIVATRSVSPSRLSFEVLESASAPAGWRPARVFAKLYPLITLAVLAFLTLSVRKAPGLNQAAVIALASTLIPPNAGEYTLLNLYVPFAAFVVFLVHEVATDSVYIERKTLLSLAIVFGLLFAPLSFLRIYYGTAKFIALLALAWILIKTPMPSSMFDDEVVARP